MANMDAAAPGGCGGNDGHDDNDGNNGVDPFGLDCYNDGWCDRIGCEECSPQDIEYPGRPCARQCRKYGLQNPYMIHVATRQPHVRGWPTCPACSYQWYARAQRAGPPPAKVARGPRPVPPPPGPPPGLTMPAAADGHGVGSYTQGERLEVNRLGQVTPD